MNWTLNGIRIFVQKHNDGVGAIIARLQPLRAGTVLQSFGYESNKVKLSGLVVGFEDRDALKSLTTSGDTSVELTSPEGSLGYYFVNSVEADWERTVSQTIRPDLDCTAPVFTVNIELFEDV